MTSYKYKFQKFPLENSLLEKIIEFDESQMKYNWSHKQWSEMNDQSPYQLYLSTLVDDTQLVGFALFSISFEQAHLLKIAVRQFNRNQNIASGILEQNFHNLLSLSVSEVYLEVATDNFAANSFYRKHGFKNLTVKKNFYSEGTDANAMSLKLK